MRALVLTLYTDHNLGDCMLRLVLLRCGGRGACVGWFVCSRNALLRKAISGSCLGTAESRR